MANDLREELLEENNHFAYPSAYARTIPAFRDLITRDRGSKGDSQGRKKLQAARELAYIYFMENPKSQYMALPEDKREERVINAVFPEPWKPDKAVQKAREVYRQSVDTIAVKLLKSSYKAVHQLRDYFENLDLSERDDNNKPVHKATDVMKSLADLGRVVDGLEKLEERVRAESKSDEGNIRGGVEINAFNE
jgi:hypothetical protein